MRTRQAQRGTTILEAMIAMGVLMIGAAGLVGLQAQSTHFMGDSRRTTRAAMFAQDLANQIELWNYDDPRLSNTSAGNDADIGDSAQALNVSVDPLGDGLVDHLEADLGADWNGMPRDLLDVNWMERYWTVADAPDTNGNGVADGKQIAVIVRWPSGVGKPPGSGEPVSWRRVVFMVTKVNGADAL